MISWRGEYGGGSPWRMWPPVIAVAAVAVLAAALSDPGVASATIPPVDVPVEDSTPDASAPETTEPEQVPETSDPPEDDPTDEEPGTESTDEEVDPALFALAAAGSVILVGLAAWWMIHRHDLDAETGHVDRRDWPDDQMSL